MNGVTVTAVQGTDPVAAHRHHQADHPDMVRPGHRHEDDERLEVGEGGRRQAEQARPRRPRGHHGPHGQHDRRRHHEREERDPRPARLPRARQRATSPSALLGPSSTSSTCSGEPNSGAYGRRCSVRGDVDRAPYPNAAPANNYQNANGTLNTSSQIVKTINCFDTSSVGTDLGTPIQKAPAYLDDLRTHRAPNAASSS